MALPRSIKVALALCAGILSARAAIAGTAPDISGMWWINDYDSSLTPADGSAIPFTEKGLATYRQNILLQEQGQLLDKAVSRCLPPGLPRAMLSGYPLKIIQHQRSVTFIHEQNHAFWHAVVGAKHSWTDNDESAFMGADSVARWEGGTLVIDTIAFKPNGFLDEHGMPHTDQLHVMQRMRKIHHGKELEVLMTVEDPAIFTKPWESRRTYEWRPDVKLMEYICGESQRALTGDRTKALRLNWKPR